MIKLKRFTKVGIVGYGVYVPQFRLTVDEIAKAWKKDGRQIAGSLGLRQKAVADWDEDCLTMAVEASRQALKMAGVIPHKIGACMMGSESFPYAVKPTSTTLAQVLGGDNEYFCADLQFACKAGTAGVQVVAAMIEAGMIDYGLVAGSDKSQGKPGDVLEYTAASAAGALVLGSCRAKWLAELVATASFTSDTPDFWRRSGQDYPSHTGRFTGEPAYFKHVTISTESFLKKIGKKPADFDWVIFHTPNKKFPQRVAANLGFSPDQLKYSLLVEEIGNPYSASVFVSLSNVLDHAGKGQDILLTAYGSGAGSDSFWLKTTDALDKKKTNEEKPTAFLADFQEIDYSAYLRKMEII